VIQEWFVLPCVYTSTFTLEMSSCFSSSPMNHRPTSNMSSTSCTRRLLIEALASAAERVHNYDSTWEEEWTLFNVEFETHFGIQVFTELALNVDQTCTTERARMLVVEEEFGDCRCDECVREEERDVVEIV